MKSEMEKAREAAKEAAKRTYSMRDMFKNRENELSLLESIAFNVGFDAGVKAAEPQWVRIRSEADLPKISGLYLIRYGGGPGYYPERYNIEKTYKDQWNRVVAYLGPIPEFTTDDERTNGGDGDGCVSPN